MSIDLVASETELRNKFFSLSSPEDVAALLELRSYAFLEYTIFIIPESARYTKYVIPKKRGGRRVIQEPIPNLKIIQHKLLQVLRVIYEPKLPVHGFNNDKSIVTNAAQHIRSRYVFNLDLNDFFPSINFGRVRGMFMAYPYHLNDKVSTVLAQICTLHKGLPQGAPTSPIISNMICAKLDSNLLALAKKHRCRYTRYADDITFSTSVRIFPGAIALVTVDKHGRHIQAGVELEEVINKNGFKINEEKIRLQTKNKRQEVTGLTTNQFVNVNRNHVRQIRAMLHAWEKFGYSAAESEYLSRYHNKPPDKAFKNVPSFQHVIKGKIEFVAMVKGRTNSVFVKLNNKAAQLECASPLSSHLFRIIHDPEEEIISLIKQGETTQVEFKVGACLNPYTDKDDRKKMTHSILKEVAAFMNSGPGGTVIIGVADDKNIYGIEREYKTADQHKANWDGYELFLTNILNDSLSIKTAHEFYNISSHSVYGKIVCLIRVSKANKPVLIKEQLYIRVGTQSKELQGDEKVDFIMNWQVSN